MSHFIDFERELSAKLKSGTEDIPSIVRWATDKIVQSYHLGIKREMEHPHLDYHREPNRRDRLYPPAK